MNQEFQNHPNPNHNNEEVDLIRLLNYFKNGIKSFFRLIRRFFESILYFIILLKKNWILIAVLTFLGAAYGCYLSYTGKETKKYEMVVKTNPISNIELYSLAEKLQNQIGVSNDIINNIGIKSMQIEAVKMNEDIIDNYFNQIEGTSFRGDQTDTLYYQAFELKDHKSKMTEQDFTFQKIKLSTESGTTPKNIQARFLDYINNLSGIKREQESRLNALVTYENLLKRYVANIDSLLVARTVANKNTTAASNEQVLVSTTSRGNVEADLLRYSEVFSRRLFGTQKLIAENQKGVQIVSQLKLTSDNKGVSHPAFKYALIGFILSAMIVLVIEFNKYLNKYSERKRL